MKNSPWHGATGGGGTVARRQHSMYGSAQREFDGEEQRGKKGFSFSTKLRRKEDKGTGAVSARGLVQPVGGGQLHEGGAVWQSGGDERPVTGVSVLAG
jgi:hypothetical protein